MTDSYRLALLFVRVMEHRCRRGRVVDRRGALLSDLYQLLYAIDAGDWPVAEE